MFRVSFAPIAAAPVDKKTAGRRRSFLLRKYPRPPMARQPILAVVGGGPSALNYVDEIAAHDEIWAINGTWRWLADKGIVSTGFTVDSLFDDPAPTMIYGDGTDPRRVAKCKNPFVADLQGLARGTTTATTVPHLAIELGYREVWFYGCEGSFDGEKTHSFKSIDGNRIWLECGGKEFVTNSQMFMQCEALSDIMRMAPHVFIDRSGGLLGAMISCPQVDMTHFTPELFQAVKRACE